jgi:predicted Abi (CAAX) family protease
VKSSQPRSVIGWRQPGWQLALGLWAVQGIEPRKEWRELCPYLVIIKLWKVIGKNYIAIRAMVKAAAGTDIVPDPEHDTWSSSPEAVVCKIQEGELLKVHSR